MSQPHASASDTPQISLCLLATTDLHGALNSYDYFADQPGTYPALTRIATLVQAARAEAPNTLLLDNGDFLQGTPLTDLISDRRPEGLEHPSVLAMNAMGYDAIALGNHEFDVDLQRLTELLGQIDAPVLCANLTTTANAPTGLADRWQPQILLDRDLVDDTGQSHSLRIGLFGILPPQVLSWDHSRVAGKLIAEDSVQASRRAVQTLRNSGADLVIGLAHTGLSAMPTQDGMENAGRQIAAIPGLDALILGHTHLLFPGAAQPQHPEVRPDLATVHNTPTMQPGANGGWLGRMTLTLGRSESGWQVQGHKVTLLDALKVAEDETLSQTLAPAHAWVLNQLRQPIGHIRTPLHSGLAMLPGCATVRIVAEALLEHASKAQVGTNWSDLPLLASAAPQKCGGRGGPAHFTRIPAGEIALNNISDLQFFPNDASVLKLTGAELVEWLEMSAGLYHQIMPGQIDQPLRRPDFPIYNADAIYGLNFEIDLTQPARYAPDGTLATPGAHRIRNLRWRGAPLPPDQTFALAVNNYRAGGGGNYPNANPERILLEDQTKIRDLLITAFSNGDPSTSDTPPPARFTPIPGATALFETSPDMRQILFDHPDERLEIIGETRKGFLQLRLYFD